jgi:hypothetical protein
MQYTRAKAEVQNCEGGQFLFLKEEFKGNFYH